MLQFAANGFILCINLCTRGYFVIYLIAPEATLSSLLCACTQRAALYNTLEPKGLFIVAYIVLHIVFCHVLCYACAHSTLEVPILCYSFYCNLCYNLCFTLRWSLCLRTATKKPTRLLCVPLRCTRPCTQSFIPVWEGKSFRALWFYSGSRQKSSTMGSVARAEGCSGKPPTFMTTSTHCPDSGLQNRRRQFEQIHLVIWTNKLCYLEKSLFSIWTNTCLLFGQKHFVVGTNTFLNLDRYICKKKFCITTSPHCPDSGLGTEAGKKHTVQNKRRQKSSSTDSNRMRAQLREAIV